MRTFKLIGALVVVVVALTAIAAATASAAITLYEFLPGTAGETFIGESGKATLQETKEEGGKGAAINCKQTEALLKGSELTGPTLATSELHFTGCTVAGLASNSLGDKSGIILVTVNIHTCLIEPGRHGLIFTVTAPLHIETPAASLLILLLGSFVGQLKAVEAEPSKSFALVIEQKEGKQKITNCEGGEALTLLLNTDANGYKKVGEEVKEGTFTFDNTAQTLMP